MSLLDKYEKQIEDKKPKKIKPKPKPKSKPKKPKKKVLKKDRILNPTLDTLRGIYFFLTGIGDKSLTKNQITIEIKKRMLDPNSFGLFLENLARYLKST
ncbi:MAG: hypothetical protein GF317_23175 [Candidatus Lokiarchaeota archaeon]|nr:hypothetical protein [Candidatus Lokiarchaeota archaeon]